MILERTSISWDQSGIPINSVEDSAERLGILLPRSLPGLKVNNFSQFTDWKINVWRLCRACGCNSLVFLFHSLPLFPLLRAFYSVIVQLAFPGSGILHCFNLCFRFLKLRPELNRSPSDRTRPSNPFAVKSAEIPMLPLTTWSPTCIRACITSATTPLPSGS